MSNLTEYPDIKSEEEIYSNKQQNEFRNEEFTANLEKYKPYIKRIIKAKKKIAIFNFVFLLLIIVYLFFISEPYYLSSITILPEYGGKSTTFGQLGEIAAMAGVRVGESTPTEIYENLILSESILKNVIYSKYQTNKFKDSVNLLQYYEIELDKDLSVDLAERKRFCKIYDKYCKQLIKTDLERLTRILTFTVEAPESKLSADIVNNIAISLDDYIRTKRKSFASEQCYYLEKRTKQVSDSLTIAENKLKNFSERNRVIIQSPNLLLEQARLTRNVEVLQTVNIELTKQLELARLDQIKDAPVLNIREIAKEPVIKTGPKRAKILAIASLFSVLISFAYFAAEDKVKRVLNSLKLLFSL